jgi:HAMP domain-containing protein
MQKVDAELPQETVPVRGRDELAQLAGNFNAMIARLSLANYWRLYSANRGAAAT